MSEQPEKPEASPTGPRRVSLMRPDLEDEGEDVPAALRKTDPRGYAEPRPTPVQVMHAIKRPPA